MIPGMIPACTNCTSIYMYMYYCLRITLHWTYLWTFKFPWKSSHHINSISPTYSNTKTSQATYEQAVLIKHYMYMYLLWLGIFWVSFFFWNGEGLIWVSSICFIGFTCISIYSKQSLPPFGVWLSVPMTRAPGKA